MVATSTSNATSCCCSGRASCTCSRSRSSRSSIACAISFTDLGHLQGLRATGSGWTTTSRSSTIRSSGTRPATPWSWSGRRWSSRSSWVSALALFFNQHLRGSWFVRGALILPMLLTPIVVGVMWRALLNPDWGIVNWIIKQLGLPPINWLGSTEWSIRTLVIADTWQWTPFVFLIVYARLQVLPQHVFEAAQVDGAGRLATFRHITLPLLAPAIAFCGHLPGHRCLPVVRPGLWPDVRWAGALDDDAELPDLSERLRVPALRLLGGHRLRDGRHPHRAVHGDAALRAAAGHRRRA